jgi:hypothetical protein
MAQLLSMDTEVGLGHSDAQSQINKGLGLQLLRYALARILPAFALSVLSESAPADCPALNLDRSRAGLTAPNKETQDPRPAFNPQRSNS